VQDVDIMLAKAGPRLESLVCVASAGSERPFEHGDLGTDIPKSFAAGK
jgi:hypothetical protein